MWPAATCGEWVSLLYPFRGSASPSGLRGGFRAIRLRHTARLRPTSSRESGARCGPHVAFFEMRASARECAQGAPRHQASHVCVIQGRSAVAGLGSPLVVQSFCNNRPTIAPSPHERGPTPCRPWSTRVPDKSATVNSADGTAVAQVMQLTGGRGLHLERLWSHNVTMMPTTHSRALQRPMP